LTPKLLERSRLDDLVSILSNDYQVFGPVARKADVSFQEVSSAEMLDLNYTTTTLPPKKFFHLRETLLEYREGEFNAPELDLERSILLFGVHPCDLNAILRMDRLLSKEFVDLYYLRRRENSAIVALNCTEVGENCFCASLGTGPAIDKGFDLLLTDLGDSYLVEVGTLRGQRMIEDLNLEDASQADLRKKEELLEAARAKFKKSIRMEGLAEVAAESPDHEVWTLIGESGGLAGCFPCLSCGNCSLVCPTCYCYEVADIPDITLRAGVRRRELDSCQLLEYAKVAMGHNFRPDRKSRVRHWMTCKFGGAGGGLESSCVGCGRCIHSCPAHIDLTEVAKALWGE